MARKTHPQDQWQTQQLSRVVGYAASIFFNGRNNTMRFQTREEAEAMAARMSAVAENGQRAMVYGVTPEGFTIYVSTH